MLTIFLGNNVNIGCLLRSYPADLIFDNTSGYSFTCDLTDNIAAPWPSSSSMTSLSLCAPGNHLSLLVVLIVLTVRASKRLKF